MEVTSITQQVLQQLINGISLGSIYALIALGYTMVYGIIKLINFAHGDIFMVSTYVAFFSSGLLIAWLGQAPPVVIFAATVVLAMMGTSLLAVLTWVITLPKAS